jgi:hypothetical protein
MTRLQGQPSRARAAEKEIVPTVIGIRPKGLRHYFVLDMVCLNTSGPLVGVTISIV